jgi:nicotinamidase-related amidase
VKGALSENLYYLLEMGRALVIVDVQRDYFPGGSHPLEAPGDAAAAAKRLLESFRASG